MKQNYDAVIIANGEYPFAPQALQIITDAPYVVCCDGGADNYISRGHTPDIIIGDGDSLSSANRDKYAHLFVHVTEQENNDQTKAVKYLMKRGINHIAIVGATGKREDHTLGNISLLIEYARAGAHVRSYTNYGVFIPCKGKFTHTATKGEQISIFNFGAKNFASKGLLYPIYDFTNWWQGTLNECTQENVEITADGEYMVFINYPDR